MTRVEQLDAIVKQFELNGHPFYQDWKMGTLPTEKLSVYAAEYGSFVAQIAGGWETLGESFYAEEEREHEELWANFQEAIGSGTTATLPSTSNLTESAGNLFAEPATAVGALYAFEAQQPYTSKAKLEGLNDHYQVSDAGKEYFRVHADDIAEVELLRGYVEKMSEEEFAQTKTACAIVCTAMYGALDGIYFAKQPVNA